MPRGDWNKGTMTTPENPGDSILMLWINRHMDYQGDECLIWPFACSSNGYASYGRGGKSLAVHRFMCERRNGPPPTSQHHAAHSCGRGSNGCVNPQHLSWKTNSENQLDMRVQGGGKNGKRYKLTPDQVAEIRSLGGKEKTKSIAERFGVRGSTVRQILSGRIWRTGQYVHGRGVQFGNWAGCAREAHGDGEQAMTVPSFTEAEKIVRKIGVRHIIGVEALAEFGIRFMREASLIEETRKQYQAAADRVNRTTDADIAREALPATQEQPGSDIAKLCDQLDTFNTVSHPQECADLMDEARLAIMRLAGLVERMNAVTSSKRDAQL